MQNNVMYNSIRDTEYPGAYVCDDCDMVFSNEQSYREHMNNEHIDWDSIAKEEE